MKAISLFFVSPWFMLSLIAAPINEPFDYPEGNLIGRLNTFESISWLQAGPNDANQPNVISGNLEYPGKPPAKGNRVLFGGVGTSVRFSFANLHTVRTNALFYSFLMQATDITGLSTSGIFWASFNNTQGSQTATPTVAAARLITRGVINESGVLIGYQLGVSKTSGTVADFQFAPALFTTNDVIFIVVSYDYSTDQSSLWVNPDPSIFGAPTPPPADAGSTGGGAFGNIRSFVLYNRNAAQPQRVIVDDLLIGPAWADVAPRSDDMDVVIAPVDQQVVAGREAFFEVRSGRAESLRWQFDGADLPGATGTNVVIPGVVSSNAGTYSVILSNAAGLVTNRATLSVIPEPGPTLFPLWRLAPGSRPYVTSGDLQRTMACYGPSNHVYILSRTNNASALSVAASGLTINVLNAATGEFLYELRLTNASGADVISAATGSILLGGIAVADDGAIYASNISDTGGGSQPQWRLYRWANGGRETEPKQVFGPGSLALQTISLRWGDVLSVRGSGTNTQVLIDDEEGLFGLVLTPTDESLETFEYLYAGVVFQYFTQSYGRGSVGRSLQFGPGNTFWQLRRNRPYGRPVELIQSEYDFSTRSSVVRSNLNIFNSLTGPIGMDGPYLAALLFAPDAGHPDAVGLYDISNLARPVLISRQDFPVNRQSNANSYGQVIVSSNRVFALDANNGVMAFEIVPAAVVGPTLEISLSGDHVVLSWPDSAAGFALQKTGSLSSPGWDPVNQKVLQQGGRLVVNDPISGSVAFYRLSKP